MVEVMSTVLASRPTLHTSLDAVRANVRLVRDRTPAEIMAVVKADGYGAGSAAVARASVEAGATWVGTTSIAEAAALRDDGIRTPILAWLHPAGIDAVAAQHARIDVAVAGEEELEEIRGSGCRGLRVHLHLDTGMARGGVPRGEWPALFAAAGRAERAGAVVVAGVMGHLPDAAQGTTLANRDGVLRMREGVRAARAAGLRPAVRHLGATAAALTDPASHLDLVRIGAGLVGIDPSGTTPLRAALTLTAPVVHAVSVPAGTAVGYDGRHVTRRATHLCVIGVGYADGVPQHVSPAAEVGLGGRRHRVVGAVSMDQIVVDTGPIAYPRGTVATIFGTRPGDPSIHEWARWASTIPHAIVTGVGRRVHRCAG